MSSKTLLIGASTNPERYSHKAILSLRRHGQEVLAIAQRPGQVADIDFQIGKPILTDIDTVTLYINATNQADYIDYILQLKPRRIIFNPGTENPAFMQRAEAQGILCENACTLVLLQTGQYQ